MKKLYLILCLLGILMVGCANQNQQMELKQLQEEKIRLEEEKAQLQMELANALTHENDSRSAFQTAHYQKFSEDQILIYEMFDQLEEISDELEEGLPGMYYVNQYLMVIFPSGKLLRIHHSEEFGGPSLWEGTLQTEHGNWIDRETVPSGGGELWETYELTNDGLRVAVYPPMYTASDKPNIIEFKRVRK